MSSRSGGDAITASWEANARLWTEAVRGGAIPSRKAGTDAAILAVVARIMPDRLLDVGCGEGWLARAAVEAGSCRTVVGVDGSAALIAAARERDPAGRYIHADYGTIARDPAALLGGGPFDLVACNFALLDDDAGRLLGALRRVTTPAGHLAIQTLHPWTAIGDGHPYATGWREEDFAAMGQTGWAPMPWLYRTLADWVQLLTGAGWTIAGIEEPTAPGAARPLSLILIGRPAAGAP